MFDRPTHADMAALIRLINVLDDRAMRDQGIDEILGRESIDKPSLGHLAAQRAMRAMGVTTIPEIQARQREFIMLASVYHEAFVMGMWWEQDQRAGGG